MSDGNEQFTHLLFLDVAHEEEKGRESFVQKFLPDTTQARRKKLDNDKPRVKVPRHSTNGCCNGSFTTPYLAWFEGPTAVPLSGSKQHTQIGEPSTDLEMFSGFCTLVAWVGPPFFSCLRVILQPPFEHPSLHPVARSKGLFVYV